MAIFSRLRRKTVPAAVQSCLKSSDRVFDFLSVGSNRFLLVTMRALFVIDCGENWGCESEAQVQRYGWYQVANARWDSENGTLRIVFHEGEDLLISPAQAPGYGFMDIIREALSETQVFATPLQLPSRQRVTAQILRDDNRNLYLYPPISSFENYADQQYLRSAVREWEQKLGVTVRFED